MRNLTALFTFGAMCAGSLIGGNADAADYIKNAYGVSPIDLTDPIWLTDPTWTPGSTDGYDRVVGEPLPCPWSVVDWVVDWQATDLVVLAPSYVDLPGDTYITFHDGALGLTVGEMEVSGAADLLAQLDTMVPTRGRRLSRRSRVYRSIDRSIRTGVVTVILSDDLFYRAIDAAGISDRFSLDSVLVINPDSMHPGSGWVSSNPTPHP